MSSASVSLWAALVCKFLEALCYMMSALILRGYLEENFMFGDRSAGNVYGMWGAMTTICGLLGGPIVDKVGVRYSLLFGSFCSAAARFALAFTLDPRIVLLALFGILPIGQSLVMPVVLIAMRRYQIAAVGSITYAMLFLSQCTGFFAAGIVVDVLRAKFPHSFKEIGSNGLVIANSTQPSLDRSVWVQMSAYRYILMISALTTCLLFVLALLFIYDEEIVWVKRKDKKNKKNKTEALVDKEDDISKRPEDDVIRGFLIVTEEDLANALGDEVGRGGSRWEMQSYDQAPTGTVSQLLSSLNVRPFWMFVLLMACTIGVRMQGRHMDATFPMYAERELGKNVHYGMITSANPLATIIFTFFGMLLCSKLPLIPGIMLGISISTSSALWLVWKPSVLTAYAFSITMALGDSLWVPRFFELSIGTTAPQGQEGMFSALVYAPTFFVKIFTGILSGNLLKAYVPENGPHNSQMMWLIIFLMALTSPVLIGIFQGCFGLFDILKKPMQSSNEKLAVKKAAERTAESESLLH